MFAALQSLAGPARIACLASLQKLQFHECPTFKRLPSYVRELGVLKELSFAFMARLKALPDARGLTALQSLHISYCPKIKQLPMGIGELPCTAWGRRAPPGPRGGALVAAGLPAQCPGKEATALSGQGAGNLTGKEPATAGA